LSIPMIALENSEYMLIATEREGHVRLGLMIFPPFKSQYCVPLGEIISKPRLVREEIILDETTSSVDFDTEPVYSIIDGTNKNRWS